MESLVTQRLTTLGHPQRLAVFRLLMRRYPDRVPATEIAHALGLKPNTLSTYLNALRQCGLVTQTRDGTSLRYAIDMMHARETVTYLMQECCRGRPEICETNAVGALRPHAGQEQGQGRYSVLFVCTGNSARSIMAEAILRAERPDRFEAFSAGTHPRGAPHPMALDLLRAKGHPIDMLRSKSVDDLRASDAPHFDFVFTVCDQAANEDCPVWTGTPIATHWGLPDPAAVQGTDAERALAFQQTYGALHNRIRAFTALPVETLDRVALQRAVDDIARNPTGELS
ncbi:helix-turn-helix domain-containing protein [Cognatishimia sp. F0-27]|uniref:arsenate reductase/protein-tyrosine-phosphatase family protein n=1 Tax=Cognatishimia sp. F0-27 TaxID=2816855 RepID=UPI001D0CD241|nr:helix-turn-helix domain-containing protein [Cognatishimia sp. F0-27]MCC1493089.1 helix-turn-helix domain-containing protein [Cognatishimia sp. F0-27]